MRMAGLRNKRACETWEAEMDAAWLDRDWAAANITGVDFRKLAYVPGAGLYYLAILSATLCS